MPIAAVIILRFVQLLSLIGLWIGLQQIPALANVLGEVIRQANWTWPSLCARIAAVTGPILASVGVLAGLEYTLRTQARRAKAIEANSSQPWLSKPEWAAKHIQLSSRPVYLGLAIFLLFYLAVLLPLAVASEKLPFVVMWAVLGLVLLVFVRLLWLGRKWSNAELKIATMPGVIGGPFSAVAIIRHTFPEQIVFEVNLRCVQARTEGTRKNRRQVQVDLWTSTQFVQKRLTGSPPGTTAVPISFAVPFDARPTTMTSDEPISWLLSISEKAEVNMGGATFEVPVFKTADSSPDYEPDQELMSQYLQRIDPLDILRRYNLQRSTQGHQAIFEFNEFQSSIFITLGVMTLMLVAVEIALFYWITKLETFGFVSLFPGIFIAMFLYGMVYMLFWRCHIVVTQQDQAPRDFVEDLQATPTSTCVIEACSGILGLRKSLQVVADRETKLVCKLDHRVNNKEQWSIHLTSDDGQSLKLLSTLEDPEVEVVAKWLAEQLHIGHRRVKSADKFL